MREFPARCRTAAKCYTSRHLRACFSARPRLIIDDQRAERAAFGEAVGRYGSVHACAFFFFNCRTAACSSAGHCCVRVDRVGNLFWTRMKAKLNCAPACPFLFFIFFYLRDEQASASVVRRALTWQRRKAFRKSHYAICLFSGLSS